MVLRNARIAFFSERMEHYIAYATSSAFAAATASASFNRYVMTVGLLARPFTTFSSYFSLVVYVATAATVAVLRYIGDGM